MTETSDTGIWFSADLHLNHRLLASLRGFELIEDMNEVLIEHWNERVLPSHRVYLVGDISMRSPSETRKLLDRLNGKIYLIRGNHEGVAESAACRDRFEWIKDVYMLRVPSDDDQFSSRGKIRIWLSHYAHRVWPQSHYRSLHLYGHSHSRLEDDPNSLSMDIGIDAVPTRAPVSLEWVLAEMKARKDCSLERDETGCLPRCLQDPRKWGEDAKKSS